MKRALVLGIGGQVGSYLAEYLLDNGWEVHGTYRHSSTGNLSRISHLLGCVVLHRADLLDAGSIQEAIFEARPHQIYNMADQDSVNWSFSAPAYQLAVTASAVGGLLDNVLHWDKSIKVYQPVSATIFGNAPAPQDETTPLAPMSPYAVAKAAALLTCRYYREVHDVKVSCGICYNHDSPRRGEEYLLHKIAKAVARGKPLPFADSLDFSLDVGFARDYAIGAYLALNGTRHQPDDYVFATGTAWTIKELIWAAAEAVGVTYTACKPFLTPGNYARPGNYREPTLLGNPAKARRELGWNPKTNVADLMASIVEKYVQSGS